MNTRSLKVLSIGFVAGLLGGLLTGLVARLVMRAVALIADVHVSCTLIGSLVLIGVLTGAGALLGPVFMWLRHLAPGPDEVRGLGFGLLLLAVSQAPTRLFLRFTSGGLSNASSLVCTVLFAVLMPVYGISIGLFAILLERRLLNERGSAAMSPRAPRNSSTAA